MAISILRYIGMLFLTFFAFCCEAQNLVPNPGFENMNACPTEIGCLGRSNYLSFPSVTDWCETSEACPASYYNACANHDTLCYCGVPNNLDGYQYAHSGNGYACISAYGYDKHDRELGGANYIEVKLLSPLQKGIQYCVCYYVDLAIPKNGGKADPITNVDAYLSVTQVHDHGDCKGLSLTPSVKNTSGYLLHNDTLWTKVSGIYVAGGGEQWLTIGNFSLNATTTLIDTAIDTLIEDGYYIDDVSVEAIDFPNASKDTTISCLPTLSNFSKTLYAEPGGMYYSWSNGSTGNSTVITDTGCYWYQTNFGCGPVVDSIHISLDTFLRLTTLPRDTAICEGQAVTLRVNDGFDSYVWSTGNTTNTIKVTTQGLYVLAASDVCGVQVDSINVTVNPVPLPPALMDTAICQAVVDPIINAAGEDLLWYSNLFSTGQAHIGINTMIPGIDTFYVSQTLNGCASEKSELIVTVDPLPVVLMNSDTIFCKNEIGMIGVAANANYRYQWSTGDTFSLLQPAESGSYILSVSNECGIATDTVNVLLSDCAYCLVIPSAFTPDNDGLNDKFRVHTICPVKAYELIIYNRWGQVVFHTTDIDVSWDGTFESVMAEVGVYFYTIKYCPATGNAVQFKKGDITLIR